MRIWRRAGGRVAARPRAERTTTAVLSLRDLAVSFPGGVQALRGVSLEVAPGEIVGLVGESGAGKTVLGLAALGLLPPSAELDGHVFLGDVDMATATDEQRRVARKRFSGAVFQDPMTSLNPTMTVGRQVAEVAGSTAAAIEVARTRAGARHPAAGGPVPARAVGRLTPAGDDRHGRGRSPGSDRRRRTDHGPGHHRPGRDPAVAVGAAGRDRLVDAVRHPRLRGRRQPRGSRGGPLRRPAGRDGTDHRAAAAAGPSLHRRAVGRASVAAVGSGPAAAVPSWRAARSTRPRRRLSVRAAMSAGDSGL